MKKFRELPTPYKIVHPNSDGTYTVWSKFSYASDCYKAWAGMFNDHVLIAIGEVLINPEGINEAVVTEAMVDANGLWFWGAK